MVKGSLLEADQLVGESLDERRQCSLLTRSQVQYLNVGIEVVLVGAGEVTAAVVEVHHLLQRQLAAVVEVGSGEFDVAQARRLEGPIHRHPLVRLERLRSSQ